MKVIHIIPSHKLKSDLSKSAVNNTTTYYLSSNYSLYVELRQRYRNRIRNLSDMFQKTFHENRKLFLETFSRINKTNDSFEWWGSSIASKSTTANPLIQNITYLLCLEKILSENPEEVAIILDSYALARSIEEIAVSKGYRVICHFNAAWKSAVALKNIVFDLARVLRFILTAVYERIISTRYLKAIGGSQKEDNKRVVVVRSWVTNGNFNNNGDFFDRNFGILPEWLRSKNYEVLQLPMFFNLTLKKTELFALLQKQDSFFLIPEKYLSLTDYIGLIVNALKMKLKVNRNITIRGIRIDRLLEEARKAERLPLATYDLHVPMLKRLKRKGLDVDVFYYAFEGNAPEKQFLINCRKHFNRSKTVGFQHTAFYPNLLSNQLGPFEKECHPVPDKIICSGNKYVELHQTAGFSEKTVTAGPNLRYVSVHNHAIAWNPNTATPKILLLPLTFSYDLAYELIDKVHQTIGLNTEYVIYIRNHPLLHKNKITTFLKRIGLKDFGFADTGTIHDWFEKSFAVIFSIE